MTDTNPFDMGKIDIAWCPGCGNYGILRELKTALVELNIKPEQLVMVSGIGQAAKIPHYLKTHFFNGLHGRSLPVATAIKACNPNLVVIAESGDGCTYGEGGNHFIHAIRRNPHITNIVHDNMVYGLTKGQASPTSLLGFKTPVQVEGVILEPFNPLAVAIALDASFVARTYSGDLELTVEILKKAITHKGYALIDLLHPCPSFNRINTPQWYKDHTYLLDNSHDPTDRQQAFQKATERDKLPLGVFYLNPRSTFEENLALYRLTKEPLFQRPLDISKLSTLINSEKE